VEQGFSEPTMLPNITRAVMLHSIDTLWIDHLDAMSQLRQGIGLRGYGQQDPLVEYKKESYFMFQHLLTSIDHEIVYFFFKQAKHALNYKIQQEMVNRSLLRRIGMQMSGAVKKSANRQCPVLPACLPNPKLAATTPAPVDLGRSIRSVAGKHNKEYAKKGK